MSFTYNEGKKYWTGSFLRKQLKQMKLWSRLPTEAVGDAFLEVFSWPGSSVTWHRDSWSCLIFTHQGRASKGAWVFILPQQHLPPHSKIRNICDTAEINYFEYSTEEIPRVPSKETIHWYLPDFSDLALHNTGDSKKVKIVFLNERTRWNSFFWLSTSYSHFWTLMKHTKCQKYFRFPLVILLYVLIYAQTSSFRAMIGSQKFEM